MDRVSVIFLRYTGIDKAIFFTLATQLLGAARGMITIIFVMAFLTAEEQGFQYTFMSITAIQAFFELGFSGIITQYVAHEKAFLSFDGNTFTGNISNLNRLSSLLRLIVKWYSVMSVLLFITLLVAGFIFFYTFGHDTQTIFWQAPWIVICFNTAICLLSSPFFAFIEGSGRVEDVAKFRFSILLIPSIIYCILLYSGLKLYALPISGIANIAISFYWLLSHKNISFFKTVWKAYNTENTISWRNDIFPYQWKMALSWIGGYFMFQLINPIVFSTFGAKAAGQVGFTFALFFALFGVANAWISTKVPTFSELIALKNYAKLDSLFKKSLLQSVLLLILAVLSLISIVYIIDLYNFSIQERFPSLLTFSILILTVIPTFINNSLATYLRCHKEEPFMAISLISGFFSVVGVYLTSHYLDINSMAISYLTVILFATICGYYIFLNKKKQWHIV